MINFAKSMCRKLILTNGGIAKKTAFFFILISTLTISAQVQPQGFGANLWNVNCYYALQANPETLPSDFKGYYTQKLDTSLNYGFNTTLAFEPNSVPSNATDYNTVEGKGTKYIGSTFPFSTWAITNKNYRYFSYIHKRQGFPKANYKITMRYWDDNTYLFIDGVRVPFSGDGGFGDQERLIATCYELDLNSTIEVRTGNYGGNETQAILDIIRTDILSVESVIAQDICKNTKITLDGKVQVSSLDVQQYLYNIDFDSTTINVLPQTGFQVGTSGSANSGSKFVFASSPGSNSLKRFKMGPFSTQGMDNIKLNFREYYSSANYATARIQVSFDNNNWTEIQTLTSNVGSSSVFAPILIDLPASFANKQFVYIQFTYERGEFPWYDLLPAGGFWAMDDFLVIGEGPANVSYSWTPAAGLSNPNIAHPIVQIHNSQVYTLTANVGHCNVTNDVVINMTQVPAQAVVSANMDENQFIYEVEELSGVNYSWTTLPSTGVGIFTNGNLGNMITFIPTGSGDLIVTPSNQCGNGASLSFSNPKIVTVSNLTLDCSKEMEVSWSTASEFNLDYFIIEKSRDLNNWTFVAKELANGNSIHNINYSIVDKTPWNGLIYYRVREIDLHNNDKVNNPISISCNYGDNAMSVYPNPSNGLFTIEIVSNESKYLSQIQIIDMTGKLIKSQDFILNDGITQVNFDLSYLNNGVYFVRLMEDISEIKPIKLVIE